MIKIREASIKDSKAIWEWRNDKHSLSMFKNSNYVSFNSHNIWFQNKIRDSKTKIYIGYFDDKRKIGLVRFDKQNDSKCLISINSNPEYRGKKLSSTLLKACIRNYRKINNCKLVAEIHKNNIASKNIFLKSNFQLVNEKGNFGLWALKKGKTIKLSAVLCLCHEINLTKKGYILSKDSNERLKKTRSLTQGKNDIDYLIFTGWNTGSLDLSIAEIMKKKYIADGNISGIDGSKILLEPLPKDTVGEAIYTAKNIFNEMAPTDLYIVTSDWHMQRAKEIFKSIFSFNKDINLHFCSVRGEKSQFEKEKINKSIFEFRRMLENWDGKSLDELEFLLIKTHKLYN